MNTSFDDAIALVEQTDTARAARVPVAAVEPVSFGVTCLADVQPEIVEWLWEGRLPLGKLVILEGDPGLGKSTLMIDMAARVTTGAGWPQSTARTVSPAGVLFLSYEDGAADTVRPRADAAGADCRRIHMFDTVAKNGEPHKLPTLPADVPCIEHLVKEHGVRLVVIDTLNAALAGGTDSKNGADMRQALVPLAKMAEAAHVCVVVLRHNVKAAVGRAINAGSGSIDIAGQARVVLAVHDDPTSDADDSDSGRRVLTVVKNNLVRMPATLAWHLEDQGGVARVVWDGVSAFTAEALHELRTGGEPRRGGATQDAMDFLVSALSRGARSMRDVEAAAESAGHTKATLKIARLRLGVRSEKSKGAGGIWRWSLPDEGGAATGGGGKEIAEGGTHSDCLLTPLCLLPPDTPVRVLWGNQWFTTNAGDPDIALATEYHIIKEAAA